MTFSFHFLLCTLLSRQVLLILFFHSIVAVHGLNGDAYRTWTYKATQKGEKDVLWLRDLLPLEIQDARIFTYGYDSMPAQVAGSASTKFIHHHADAFLQDLYAHRVCSA